MKRLLILALLCAAVPARAASDDAWKEFRGDVQKACEKALAEHLVNPSITVDPFGSEGYGIALARGVYRGFTTQSLMVCVYDKKTKQAQVSGAFTP